MYGTFLHGSSPTNSSAFGEFLVVQPTAIIQLQFPYNINTDYVTTSATGAGTVTSSTNFALLQTGASASSSATMLSRQRLHYQASQGCVTMYTALFTTGVANSTQKIGIGNAQDGFFFGFNGTTFGILHRVNSVDTWIPQTSWNQDKFNGSGASGVTLDPTKGNIYKIQYQWFGFGAINFFIENPNTGALVLVHQIQYANANTATSLLNPALQLMAEVINTTNATNVTLKTPSFAGIIEGFVNPDQDTKHSAYSGDAAVTVPNNSPTFNSILTIRNNSTFVGKTNQVVIYLELLCLMNSTVAADVVVTVYLNPTFGAALTYSSVNADTSVVDFSRTVTTIIAGTGTALMTIYSAGGPTTNFIDLSDYDFLLNPGDILTVAASRISGAGTNLASLSWRERF